MKSGFVIMLIHRTKACPCGAADVDAQRYGENVSDEGRNTENSGFRFLDAMLIRAVTLEPCKDAGDSCWVVDRLWTIDSRAGVRPGTAALTAHFWVSQRASNPASARKADVELAFSGANLGLQTGLGALVDTQMAGPVETVTLGWWDRIPFESTQSHHVS
jgi:hypothetical protein